MKGMSVKVKKEVFRVGLRAFPSKYQPFVNVYNYSPRKRMAVIGVDQWINYTKRERHHVNATALVLFDRDSKTWNVVRIPPNITKIDAAIRSLMPAEVKRAIAARKKVKRQGDIYFIPQRIWNITDLAGTNHDAWEVIGRSSALSLVKSPFNKHLNENAVKKVIVYHRSHKTTTLDGPHKALQQITTMGKTHSIGD